MHPHNHAVKWRNALIHIEPEFARKAEAHAAAAAVAVDMGAIDFIKHGSPEAVAKRGFVLVLLDAPGSVQEPSPTDGEEDPAVSTQGFPDCRIS